MRTTILFLLLIPFSHLSLAAQSWLYTATPPTSTGSGLFYHSEVLANGDYAFSGFVLNQDTNGGSIPGITSPYLVRVNPNGDLIWQQEYAYLNQPDPLGGFQNGELRWVKPIPTGGMYIYRTGFTGGIPGFLARLDDQGDTLWVKQYANSSPALERVEVLPNGGIILQTMTYDNQGGGLSQNLNLVRIDANGVELSTQSYPTDQLFPANPNSPFFSLFTNGRLISTTDNHLISLNRSTVTEHPTFAKFDQNGNLIWSRTFTNLVPSQEGEVAIRNLYPSADSGLVMLLAAKDTNNNSNRLVWFKIDANGDSISTQLTNQYQWPSVENGGMALSPNGDRYILFPVETSQDTLTKWNDQGQLLWKKPIGPANGNWFLDRIQWASDGGLVLSGYQGAGMTAVPLAVRLDSSGTNAFNLIRGKAFDDNSLDCIQQSGETSLSQWLIRVDPGPFYTLTDSLGRYNILTDSNQHWVSAIPPASLWSNIWSPVCPSNPDSTLVDFTGPVQPDTASGIDFAFEALIDCPLLQVDITAPFIRRCTTSTYHVNYCNFGSQIAPNAFIEVSLDSSLTFLSATIPHTVAPQPNTYRFDLDSIPVGQCSKFQITVDVFCDTLNPGRIHCATASIFPDSICDPPSSAWSNASLEVTGTCTSNDSVRFNIRNNGTGNMLASTGIWVVEDDILRLQNTLQLDANQDTSFWYAGEGSTWALIADQVPFHPGQSYPRAIIEGCGTNTQGLISTGFASQFGEDDLNPWVSIDCQEDIGSWDPNDKTGFPTGVGPNRGILSTDEMEYLIRFQNTGTDTAFKVVIKDEIPRTLDLSTFIMGAASHPYHLKIQNGNTLEWTFDPIALPDSSVDQAGSQGFVKFSIRQQANNPPGTRISNAANIFFDFNVPVLTDSSVHTIQPRLETLVTLDESPQPELQAELRVYPNPFTKSVTFELVDYQAQQLRLEVFDLNGRLVRQIELGRSHKFEWKSQGLPPGIYPFRLSDRATLLRNGKLMIARP